MPLKLWWRYKLLGGRLASLAQDRSSLLQLKEVYGEERLVLHFGHTSLWLVRVPAESTALCARPWLLRSFEAPSGALTGTILRMHI